jgi:hypothetical protein
VEFLVIFIIGLILLAVYFIPTFIALKRGHAYKWVILGINTFAIAGGVPWLVAFIWAVWPTNKSLFDPIAGNVTGKGTRNTGDTVGSIEYGRERGYLDEKNR